MDAGMVVLIAFFGAMAWLALKPRKGDAMVCTACGHHGPTAFKTKGSLMIEVVLWLMFLVPGLVYSLWRLSTRTPACTKCGSTQLVPLDSPVGKRLMAEYAKPVAPKSSV